MKVRTQIAYPYKLRVFEDGKIKSKGLDWLSKSEFRKYAEAPKNCLDCGGELIEDKPFKYKCPICNETFSWSFYTLQRDAPFYERHPEYR